MKCVCGYESDKILGYYKQEDGESFLELSFNQNDGYSVSVGRKGLNSQYKLFSCPKCGTVRMEK